jgi:hypothetical protein
MSIFAGVYLMRVGVEYVTPHEPYPVSGPSGDE